jgi:hypothetical protein
MQTKIIHVTPEMAQSYIDHMVNNRPTSEKHIAFLASAMRRGEWAITGQPVIFAPSGDKRNPHKLLDGQHRMLAVIASKCTVDMLAVYGVDESLFEKMDQGKNRSAADCIQVPNRKPVAYACRCVFVETNVSKGSTITLSNMRPSNAAVSGVLREHPGLVEAASSVGGKMRLRRLMGAGNATYCLYRMRADNAAQAEYFMHGMHTGEGLSSRSPILSLRNLLTDGVRVDGVVKRLSGYDVISMTAMAWYMHLDGRVGIVNVARARAAWTGWRTPL